MGESFNSNNNNNIFPAKTGNLEAKSDRNTPDLTYLKEMADGDEAFFNEIIIHFLENGPRLLSSLKESALSEDFEKVRFVAHKLLPQLTFVGILSAIDDVKKIEEYCNIMDDLSVVIEKVTIIVTSGIEDLRELI